MRLPSAYTGSEVVTQRLLMKKPISVPKRELSRSLVSQFSYWGNFLYSSESGERSSSVMRKTAPVIAMEA